MTITIPSIGVKAPIVAVGLQADGAMQLPDPDQVGWYKRGPRPGAPGPTVLTSSGMWTTAPARTCSTGCGSFAPGDQILISQSDGATTRSSSGGWSATQRPPCPPTASGPRRPSPLLRLITCGGSFNRATGHYRDNLIVYAARAGS